VMGKKPEDKAREQIDGMLEQAGWIVQDFDKADIHSYPGVVISFPSQLPTHWLATLVIASI
jgi:hypothetical protein